ncbi:hypothetical protein AGMMS49944_29980 [Spirochaetia bacterium]|nr:hypothetical protein AGMMS49944_29980 [Spirochaetia bacterium]
MWIIWAMVIVAVPLLALAFYGMWRNHKYDEYYKTHEHGGA